MTPIEHTNQDGTITTYEAANSIWEMSLGNFLDLLVLMRDKDADPDSLSHQMELFHLVSTMPRHEIEALPFDVFLRLSEMVTFEGLDLPDTISMEEAGIDHRKEPITFEVKGRTFKFQPDFSYTRMEYAARTEDVLRGKPLMENLHVILALCSWEEGECYDPELLPAKYQLMCEARMNDVFRPLFFFANQGTPSLLLTRVFGQEKENLPQ